MVVVAAYVRLASGATPPAVNRRFSLPGSLLFGVVAMLAVLQDLWGAGVL
jgi:hypothetical protein